MKKFFLCLGIFALLFILSFLGTYSLYKKMRGYSDNKSMVSGQSDGESVSETIFNAMNKNGSKYQKKDSVYEPGDADKITEPSFYEKNQKTEQEDKKNTDAAVSDSGENQRIKQIDNGEKILSIIEILTEDNENIKYIVNDLNGYIAVYNTNGSLYEYTDISLKEVDSLMRTRIKKGIGFEKAKELFAFLESCSS